MNEKLLRFLYYYLTYTVWTTFWDLSTPKIFFLSFASPSIRNGEIQIRNVKWSLKVQVSTYFIMRFLLIVKLFNFQFERNYLIVKIRYKNFVNRKIISSKRYEAISVCPRIICTYRKRSTHTHFCCKNI